MTRRIFVLIPADLTVGPIKGAYALANALAAWRDVTLVTLKAGSGAQAPLDPRVRRIELADSAPHFADKVRRYRELLQQAGGRRQVASISMCLSADAVNARCREAAVTCASVRGNLIANYRFDYGWPGVPVAAAHLFALRWYDEVAAMTQTMAEQVRRFSGRRPAVIGNFVDEAALEPYRTRAATGALRFAFVGSLTTRKQPGLIVDALDTLRRRGVDASADIVGDGPLRNQVQEQAHRMGLNGALRVHGFLKDPYPCLAQADAMVLPSLSEGVSRAALEALHLGVPCVLRDADGNSELIRDSENGALFAANDALANAMLRAARISRDCAVRDSLLPAGFRQQAAARQYLTLLERSR
jgi:glycosyltransferase involved in cell wall biosynthesis